jgi:hypothetical protein
MTSFPVATCQTLTATASEANPRRTIRTSFKTCGPGKNEAPCGEGEALREGWRGGVGARVAS